MTTLRVVLHLSFVIAATGFLHSPAAAQDNTRAPEKLNQNSSLSEIMSELEVSVLANARVQVKDSYDGSYRDPLDMIEPAKASWILSQGFRLTNIDGCTLALRNDGVKSFSKSLKEESNEFSAAELYIWLNRLGPTSGRSPYRYTKDPKKVSLLGAWRTEYKYKGLFVKNFLGLAFFSSGPKAASRWDGSNLAFTFDSKEIAEKFDTVFRRAIKTCQK